jgi:hypothetical protein
MDLDSQKNPQPLALIMIHQMTVIKQTSYIVPRPIKLRDNGMLHKAVKLPTYVDSSYSSLEHYHSNMFYQGRLVTVYWQEKLGLYIIES